MSNIRLSLICLAVIFTTACTTTKNIPPSRVFQLRAAYSAAFLAPAVAYRRLPLCESHAPPCAHRRVINELVRTDRAVKVALDALEKFVRENPTLSAVNLLRAAETAIATANSVRLTYGVK